MDDESKIRVISGGNTPDVAADGLRKLKANLPLLIEHAQLMAQFHWAKFEALKASGFSDAQALDLCKTL